MKILMVTDFFHPLLGGVEQHVRTLSAELCRRGHSVTVATLAVDGLDAVASDGPVRILRLPSVVSRVRWLFSQSRPWAPPIPDPAIVRALREVIRSEQPDVIHAHDWLGRSVSGAGRGDVPCVTSLHYYTRSCARKDLLRRGDPCPGPSPIACLRCCVDHYGIATGPLVAVGRAVGSRLEDRVNDALIAVSRATAVGNGLDPDTADVFVIPNFLPVDDPDDSDAHRALLDQLPDSPFMAYVGDFRATKGFDLLLDAYRESRVRMPLVVIGKRWPESPTSLPDGVVVFEEWPNRAVRSALGRAAFSLVPSVWDEPFGIVAIEALAGATPVIAADVGGLGEIIESLDEVGVERATGLTFDRNDRGALAAAITRLASDPDLCRRLGDNASQAARRYRADVVVPRVEAVYERVVG